MGPSWKDWIRKDCHGNRNLSNRSGTLCLQVLCHRTTRHLYADLLLCAIRSFLLCPFCKPCILPCRIRNENLWYWLSLRRNQYLLGSPYDGLWKREFFRVDHLPALLCPAASVSCIFTKNWGNDRNLACRAGCRIPNITCLLSIPSDGAKRESRCLTAIHVSISPVGTFPKARRQGGNIVIVNIWIFSAHTIYMSHLKTF